MSTTANRITSPKIEYPTSDGRPMAETDDHRDLMVELIETVKMFKAGDDWFYVSGNLLVFYERGNRLKHVAPDFFAVRGVRNRKRDHYLIWEEGKGPEAAIELTSRSTKEEDVDDKMWLYRDVMKVFEYFLFDPHLEYLVPPLQGYRLRKGKYNRIRPVEGRLPSKVLGLHLEQVDGTLRLYNPATGQLLPTPREVIEQSKAARKKAEAARRRAEAENEKLRRELEALQRRLKQPPKNGK